MLSVITMILGITKAVWGCECTGCGRRVWQGSAGEVCWQGYYRVELVGDIQTGDFAGLIPLLRCGLWRGLTARNRTLAFPPSSLRTTLGVIIITRSIGYMIGDLILSVVLVPKVTQME